MKQIPNELLEGYENPEDLLDSEGLLAKQQKAVTDRALEAELTAHLGYDRHDPAGRAAATAATAMTAKRSSPTAARWNWRCCGDRDGSRPYQPANRRRPGHRPYPT